MLATERRATIVERLQRTGSVRVSDLAEELDVDPVTIRRDLAQLEEAGRIHRVHGGAVLPARERLAPLPEGVERRIAEAAARFVPSGSVVFVGPGELTAETTAFWDAKQKLTIITNALDVAWRLARTQEHTLHLVGGQVEGDYGAYGNAGALPQLRADWVILEAEGLDAERGLTHDHVHYVELARALFSLGAQIMVLLPPQRVGESGALVIAPAGEVDVLVTGREAPNAPLWDLSELGVRVVLT
jgi:DeoR/GlpR family transcriptional regulator of sugar metabolism